MSLKELNEIFSKCKDFVKSYDKYNCRHCHQKLETEMVTVQNTYHTYQEKRLKHQNDYLLTVLNDEEVNFWHSSCLEKIANNERERLNKEIDLIKHLIKNEKELRCVSNIGLDKKLKDWIENNLQNFSNVRTYFGFPKFIAPSEFLYGKSDKPPNELEYIHQKCFEKLLEQIPKEDILTKKRIMENGEEKLAWGEFKIDMYDFFKAVKYIKKDFEAAPFENKLHLRFQLKFPRRQPWQDLDGLLG